MGLAKVTNVTIFNRPDCCWDEMEGAKLELLDADGSVVVDDVLNIGNVPGSQDFYFENNFDVAAVRIRQKDPSANVSLAEVEIYGIPVADHLCYCRIRRDRNLRFLPDSDDNNNNDERNSNNNINNEHYEEELERRNEPNNHRDEEEVRRALQEEDDIIPSSPFDIEVGVIKATDGPTALQTAGGASLSLGFVGTVLGLVGAVLL